MYNIGKRWWWKLIVVESECVDCPKELGCIYEACPYYKVTRYYCDCCHDEVDDLYIWDNEELCADCVLKQFEKVE